MCAWQDRVQGEGKGQGRGKGGALGRGQGRGQGHVSGYRCCNAGAASSRGVGCGIACPL